VNYLVQEAGADLEHYSKIDWYDPGGWDTSSSDDSDDSDELPYGLKPFRGTPLHRAVCHGIKKKDMISLLLELGANIEALQEHRNWGVLETATRLTQCAKTVELLLERGANVNTKGVFHWVVDKAMDEQLELEHEDELSPEYKRIEGILRVFLRHGADIHIVHQGVTPAWRLINGTTRPWVSTTPILNMLLEEGVLAWTR
jgi:ankyrin repeat protein